MRPISAILLGYLPVILLASLVAANQNFTANGIPLATRAYWMRRANRAVAEVVGSPCPFAGFGTAIVNHTSAEGIGELVCIGANQLDQTGNSSLHGEMAAINNCTAIMTDPHGRFQFTPQDALAAFRNLTLYTNAESCPMCASAIEQAGFREYVYGTSLHTLVEKGWDQIRISSTDVFQASLDLPSGTRLIGGVLPNETDPYFLWQYNSSYPCPVGCSRTESGCHAL